MPTNVLFLMLLIIIIDIPYFMYVNMYTNDRLHQYTVVKCLMMWSNAVTASRTSLWKQLKFLQSLSSLKHTSLLQSLRNSSELHLHEKAKLRFSI